MEEVLGGFSSPIKEREFSWPDKIEAIVRTPLKEEHKREVPSSEKVKHHENMKNQGEMNFIKGLGPITQHFKEKDIKNEKPGYLDQREFSPPQRENDFKEEIDKRSRSENPMVYKGFPNDSHGLSQDCPNETPPSFGMKDLGSLLPDPRQSLLKQSIHQNHLLKSEFNRLCHVLSILELEYDLLRQKRLLTQRNILLDKTRHRLNGLKSILALLEGEDNMIPILQDIYEYVISVDNSLKYFTKEQIFKPQTKIMEGKNKRYSHVKEEKYK